VTDDGRHHAEKRKTGCKIRGAIDGIENEQEPGLGDVVEQGWIRGGGFLADDGATGEGFFEPCGEQALGRFIGIGNEIRGRRFLPDLAFG
jgi:hypothetical protein